MLPPVDDDVLRDNPGFAALYSTLTNVLLNPDGSTGHDPAAKARAAVREVSAMCLKEERPSMRRESRHDVARSLAHA